MKALIAGLAILLAIASVYVLITYPNILPYSWGETSSPTTSPAPTTTTATSPTTTSSSTTTPTTTSAASTTSTSAMTTSTPTTTSTSTTYTTTTTTSSPTTTTTTTQTTPTATTTTSTTQELPPTTTSTPRPELSESVKVDTSSWVRPKACEKFDREIFNKYAVMCALSQWRLFINISKALTITEDPLATAVNIAEWIAKNIKYVPDDEAFGKENYVQLPAETFNNRFGDCEDLSLLEAALMLGTGMFNNVTLAEISYLNLEVGHVEAGYAVNNTYYLIPWINDTYPMEIHTDYYGYSVHMGADISNITVYLATLDGEGGIEVKKDFINLSDLHYEYPPKLSNSTLKALTDSINRYLLSKGYNTIHYPEYLDGIWNYLSPYIPGGGESLPLPVSYYVLIHPIDWFSPKSPEWVGWRLNLSMNTYWSDVGAWLEKAYRGCLRAYVKLGETYVERAMLTPEGTYRWEKKLTPSVIITILAPTSCNVPKTEVVSEEGRVVITVNTSNYTDLQVLIYDSGPDPVLGVVRKGWKYTQIPYITAEEWDLTGSNQVTIEFSLGDVSSKLPPGTYELIVWYGDYVAYAKIFRIG